MAYIIKLIVVILILNKHIHVVAEPVLRYGEASCETLEPTYVEETYTKFNLGIKENDVEISDDNRLELDDPPKKSNSRKSPFEINIMFDQYRRNRDYKVEITADRNSYFDAFILQAKGKNSEDGNATYVGKWVKTPRIARTINCQGRRQAAVVDIRRPIRFGNLSFVWRSPSEDKGPVKFRGSVVYNGQYILLEAKVNGSRIKNGGELPYAAFPMTIKNCGKDKGCFRYCETRPKCPAEEAEYMVTIETENSNDQLDSNEVLFKIGGYLTDNKTNYIGIGLSRSNYQMRNADVVVCLRNGNRIQSEHYLLENLE